jgi:lysophospholipase L1-like esterase
VPCRTDNLRRVALAACLALAACATDHERKAEAETPDSAAGSGAMVRFVGRFDTSDPAGPRFAWSGSAMVTRFVGTGIDVRLHDAGTNEFQVVVDGTPSSKLVTGPSHDQYTAASGLPEGIHELILVKRTEARMGEVQFFGFFPRAGGRLVGTSGGATRRVELIGDSITAGYGNEGPNPTCPFSPSTENEYLTYGAIAARSVGAEHVTIAWSGKTVEQMAELFDRTLPARPESRWESRAWVPDVVVINLGTNDFSIRDPGQGSFDAAYVGLLDKVRARYGNAQVFCALGPMLADTYPPGALNLTRARAYITAAVEAMRSKGDTRVTFLEFPAQEPMTAGCGFHPNLATHRLMADQLAAAIRSKLGW